MTRIYIHIGGVWTRSADVACASTRRQAVAACMVRGLQVAWFDYANDTFGINKNEQCARQG